MKHNGHSLFFPSFIWLVDLRFFHGNQELLFYVGLALLFVSTSLLFIPVWRDKTVDLTAKVVSSLVVVVGTFWMGRANIIASGGYDCIASLLMVGAELAFICLPSMGASLTRFWLVTVAVVTGGVIASFSFGAGLATWPVLLLLGWCLRLPWRSFCVLLIAAIAVAITFALLPPHSSLPPALYSPSISTSGVSIGLARLCRSMSAPIFHAVSGWYAKPLPAEVLRSFLALWSGAATLAAALLAITFTMIRRDLAKSSLELIGIALVTFNLVAMVLVVIMRVEHFRALPFDILSPRYFFHTSLFWAGLLLVAVQRAGSRQWARWPVYLLVIVTSLLIFPSHYKGGLESRWFRHIVESGAISLVNGIRDDQQISILAPFGRGPKQVYRVAEQLRVRRWDMFADGLQDWITVDEASLFGGRYKRERLKGQCRVDALVQCDNGAPAARVIGQAWKHGNVVPRILVIVDPTGVVCGVARSIYSESPFINRTFYLSKFATSTFVGYIRGYMRETTTCCLQR